MHALIVVAHPDPRSLTHGVAAHLAEGITLSDAGHTVEIADLAAEGFDPRFTAADIALHLREGVLPADVAAEQARINRADALVLVYPVYWWSMPGLLKGWIDRVFTNGWAYDDRADAGVVKLLGRLPVHLVGLGGADAGTYARHGYFGAMKTQIDHGIFDYCGARVVTSEFMLEAGPDHATAHLDAARAIGRRLFDISGQCEATDAA
ncbi:NAD(P)H-dependent oxidoreductase [Rhizobium leguminosarum bv. viciae 248]|uniref:NAD(P)H-dependent oxidoreductase n=1 Tax=Rhizobium leguminosarum TaxID=384 RepID=UPI00037C027A|nr:NAD(P)H-dependent oxidoreductase [Rhizobium leguminosarum]MCA2408886.1 NAD(P)H-dependent oxidoreductase [Rhizobium leguminosarum]NKM62872.1 flavodoxin family protein [Rhizobium leguminosarum bv. viciae]QHW25158.1 NAD(P)H-dependent oxidoreductase [Rhizobium leguminosarum bv. viciae 248]